MKSQNRRIIGLTGGIATGKSTVAHYLATHHHLPIFDADIYAREAVEVGSPVYQAIAQRYGLDLFLEDGTLNRKKLGDIIFNNAEERVWLEQQIHPYVRDRFAEAIQKPYPKIVCVIPLLFEAGITDLVTEIWVVICSPQQQLERLMQRNQLTREQALARINSQMSLAEKASRADVVLDNSSTPEALLQQIDAVIKNRPSA
ncbi:dephospho-CoA kinase [Gloeocapsopsis dulcis]|uniref:Dephospho-CoA kinase n=1 Tax=Gloeocapsopsis dulcis AAB1 = 1H9 TaxID=1433147 RepID=A0A6N8FSF3_9CHRO|nr:dephospho-CoA kinase [Gloeocapsopsis dulcis]MUL35684.1 dephospho-CoA kinase [Gloeocapsopsis dulcis AAB1 = 1H9]WNN91034.1 dephospho-CoA kinase [Gloeocapsopsis dulcis]